MQFCQYIACIARWPLSAEGVSPVNALAYEESAYLQYFSHLSQDLPRYDRPESLLYDPEIPPWASLPLSASAAHLRPLNSGEDVRYSVIYLCELPRVLGLDLMCRLSPQPRVDSPTLLTPLLLEHVRMTASNTRDHVVPPAP
jgi:hypothetical protein